MEVKLSGWSHGRKRNVVMLLSGLSRETSSQPLPSRSATAISTKLPLAPKQKESGPVSPLELPKRISNEGCPVQRGSVELEASSNTTMSGKPSLLKSATMIFLGNPFVL